jgi:hypothetical protein
MFLINMEKPLKHTLAAAAARHLALLTCACAAALGASALAEPAIFKDADLKLGEQLVAQNKCTQCHISKVGGDGSAIYKPKGHINDAGLLRGMVEQCNSTLNFQMFPEEVTAVAAVINRDHYKFK